MDVMRKSEELKSDIAGERCRVNISDYPFVRSVAVTVEGENTPVVSKLDFTPKMSLDKHVDMVLEEAERRR